MSYKAGDYVRVRMYMDLRSDLVPYVGEIGVYKGNHKAKFLNQKVAPKLDSIGWASHHLELVDGDFHIPLFGGDVD